MTDDLDLLDDLYKRFLADPELFTLLGSPKSPEERNERVHRELTPMSYATINRVNFISIYLSSATETDNKYVVRGFLNVEFYGKSRTDIKKMKKRVESIMDDLDMTCTSKYNVPSDTKGIHRYTLKYRPLVWA